MTQSPTDSLLPDLFKLFEQTAKPTQLPATTVTPLPTTHSQTTKQSHRYRVEITVTCTTIERKING